MPNVILSVDDLTPFAEIDSIKAQAMIDDAEAAAARVAPCITTTDDEGVVSAARAILRGAVLRWHDAGSGALQAQTIGPFGETYDTRQVRKGMFWPSEIKQLQELCSSGSSGAFSVDTVGAGSGVHTDACSLNFGALYCSCGASLTSGFWPLFGA